MTDSPHDKGAKTRSREEMSRTTTAAAADEFFHAHLLAIENSSEEIIIGETLEGVVRSWNLGAERHFRFTAQEMIGEPITRIVPEADYARGLQRGCDLSGEGGPLIAAEVLIGIYLTRLAGRHSRGSRHASLGHECCEIREEVEPKAVLSVG
jgi:PAS domain-containing protein